MRVKEVGPAQEPPQPAGRTQPVDATDVEERDGESLLARELDERTGPRRDERDVVPAPARRPRQPQRYELPAGDLSRDDEMNDPQPVPSFTERSDGLAPIRGKCASIFCG